MSLLTIQEAAAAFGSRRPSDQELKTLLAGLSEIFSRLCNRVFASRVSSLSTDGQYCTVEIPGHRFRVGQSVSIYSPHGGTGIEGVHAVAAVVDYDAFKVASTASIDEGDHSVFTCRRVVESTFPTDGTDEVFLDPRPVSEIVEVCVPLSPDEWQVVPPEDYYLDDVNRDGVSISGSLVHARGTWPSPRQSRPTFRRGVKVKFVPGEPEVPVDALYAMQRVMTHYRANMRSAGMQSESNEGYSYSKMSFSDQRKLFGEVEATIRNLKLSAV